MQVVPSCVQENKGAKFICVYCSKEISSACGIRRHYREQHFDNIPEGVFGSKIIFECKHTQDECLKLSAEKSILSLPRSSTRLSSIFEQNIDELDEVDNIISNIKQEAFEKLEENAKTNAELSLDKETLPEYNAKKGKKLARELSNMLLQNLSF